MSCFCRTSGLALCQSKINATKLQFLHESRKKSLDHDLATERAVTPEEASAGGANKMQTEREGAITIKPMIRPSLCLYGAAIQRAAELTIPMGIQLFRGFEQWLPFFRESGLETAANEDQLTQMNIGAHRRSRERRSKPHTSYQQ